VLRRLDDLRAMAYRGEHGAAHGVTIDQRWLAIAQTHIEQGFMALNRSIFQPGRVDPRWLAIGRAHLEQGFMALERAILEPWQFDLPEER
jgi:hypothetical protein